MATAENAIIRVIEGDFVVGQEYQLALNDLRSKAQEIVAVSDQHSYEEAMAVVRQGQLEMKTIAAGCEPTLIALRRRLEELRGQRDAFVGQFQEAIASVEKQAREWNIAERNAALAEQKDLNKGQRAENRVTVAPSIPSVAGTRVIVRYRAELVDISKVKRAFMTWDEKAILAEARKDKDPDVTEKKVGGVRIRQE
jgi:hypothetical protein